MPADMKEAIAQAARTLLTAQHVKKLTVKDLVEQCHITRQRLTREGGAWYDAGKTSIGQGGARK